VIISGLKIMLIEIDKWQLACSVPIWASPPRLMMWQGVDGFSPSSWEPQEEGMMSTAASFSLRKKPRFIESGKKPNSRRSYN
jgi:hypothetical protein